MNTIKRRRLKAKRTPWAKTISGRRAHVRANAMRAVVIAQGQSQINAIRSDGFWGAPTASPVSRAVAIAETIIDTQKAAAEIPVYGAKTV